MYSLFNVINNYTVPAKNHSLLFLFKNYIHGATPKILNYFTLTMKSLMEVWTRLLFLLGKIYRKPLMSYSEKYYMNDTEDSLHFVLHGSKITLSLLGKRLSSLIIYSYIFHVDYNTNLFIFILFKYF